MSESHSPEEQEREYEHDDMINEGGAIRQPSTLPPGSIPLKERGEAAYAKARTQVRHVVDDYYRPHPFRTLGIALAAGVLIGLALDVDH